MRKFIVLFFIYSILTVSSYAKDMRFAQVTDVRFSKSSNNENLRNVINDINSQKDIKFVIFTGDNINKPDKDELIMFLKELKSLKKPFYIVIGDKDVNQRKQLGKKEYAKIVHREIHSIPDTPNYVFKYEGMIFVVADGSKDVVPSTIGYYKPDVIDCIDANLDLYSKKNAVIFQHFPIVAPADKEMYTTYKSDEYLNMLSKHKNVKAVISGHYGLNKEQEVNGIAHISTAPLPYYRIIDIVDCDTKNPTVWSELRNVN